MLRTKHHRYLSTLQYCNKVFLCLVMSHLCSRTALTPGMRLFLQPANCSTTRPLLPSEELPLSVRVTPPSTSGRFLLSADWRNTQTNSALCGDNFSSDQSHCFSISIFHPRDIYASSLLPRQNLSPELQSAYSGEKDQIKSMNGIAIF